MRIIPRASRQNESRVRAGRSTFGRIAFITLFLSVTAGARAEDHSGTIALFHLNGQVPERGVCVQMVPAVPGTGWACLWKSNLLYKEITALLLEGHATGKSCQIGYTNGPDGHPSILWATCF
jgi:hypothetical protein